ncbi:Hypothetical Protein RradSPS_0803 [Rubrobacter radiotolerans]|uniref:Uncharacterized protein n=1 Tax=Rubrobacter radiotolerans TaxID=42256 RepID=A0A023X1N4_RUBRA|nr:hypothetical protein [Rubrobacter radiotolerans]AHY46086.1 Hypothetical Protein RradSPS_0803 [Rubrobacter radiotolerans]MDX5893496.1 hypothetical protein [Rubrobacter radiotolerans]SMC03851.1 hypothetical protein SAMN00767673_0802 [Rubrobacter radiotolerans DSM 5868]
MNSTFVRTELLGAAGFVLSGTAWVALGLGALLGLLAEIPGREDVVLYLLAHGFLALGLAGLHGVQRGRVGFAGRTGLYVALFSVSARALGAAVFLSGSLALEWISSPGLIGMLAGFALYGVAAFRSGTLLRPWGVALALILPVTLPLGQYGTVLFGLFLAALGLALWRKATPAAQNSRGR